MIQSKSRFLEAAKGAKPYKVNGVLMQGQEFRTFTNMFGYKEISCLLNWQDAKLLAKLSENLGPAMVGINADEIEIIMEERGK